MSDIIAIKNANEKAEANHKGMKLNVTPYLLVCADGTNLLGLSEYTQNKNTVTLLVTNMELVELNIKKTSTDIRVL